jgi:hypothetical protein
MTKTNIKHLKTMFNHQDGVSVRQAARKFNCHYSLISRTLRTHTSIRVYKKKKIPMRTEEQLERIRTCCDWLYRNLQGKAVVMDDESYFTLSHGTINGNNKFYSSNVAKTPARVKCRRVAKYEKKLLVWLCFSDKGMAEPYFVPSGLAVNQHIYLEECIKKRLIPFIEEHHLDDQYLFWPDLASAHYANSVISFLNEKSINFVPKAKNPPNVPECRPIEDFWSILKGMVYKNNWKAKTFQELHDKILKCLENIDNNLVKSLFQSTRCRVGKIRENGVIEEN